MRSERPTPSLARTERVQKPVAGRLATLPPIFLHTHGDDHPQAGRCPHMRAHAPDFPLVMAVLCSDSWLPGPLHTRFVSQSHPVPGGPILPISQKTRLRHKEVRKLLVGAGGPSNSEVHTHLGAAPHEEHHRGYLWARHSASSAACPPGLLDNYMSSTVSFVFSGFTPWHLPGTDWRISLSLARISLPFCPIELYWK